MASWGPQLAHSCWPPMPLQAGTDKTFLVKVGVQRAGQDASTVPQGSPGADHQPGLCVVLRMGSWTGEPAYAGAPAAPVLQAALSHACH